MALAVVAIALSGCSSKSMVPASGFSGEQKQIVYGPDDGSSGDGWTMKGAIIDFAGMGNPIPAFMTNINQYMYKNVGLAPNMVVEFDVLANDKGDKLGDFYFLCDSTGKGNAVTLECRPEYHSTSFIRTYNWTAWSYSDESGFTMPTERWVHVKIALGDSTGDLYVNFTDNKGNAWSFSQAGWAFQNNGGYVGFNGNGGAPHTVWWDNLVIYKKP